MGHCFICTDKEGGGIKGYTLFYFHKLTDSLGYGYIYAYLYINSKSIILMEHKELRKQFVWTQVYNKEGERIEPKQILLKDITDEHLNGIIKHLQAAGKRQLLSVMIDEKLFRHATMYFGSISITDRGPFITIDFEGSIYSGDLTRTPTDKDRIEQLEQQIKVLENKINRSEDSPPIQPPTI